MAGKIHETIRKYIGNLICFLFGKEEVEYEYNYK